MNALYLPDKEWICTVIHREDPNDDLNLFNKSKPEINMLRTINEKCLALLSFTNFCRFAHLVAKEEPTEKKRAIFRKTDQEKQFIAISYLEKKKIKKKKQITLLDQLKSEANEHVEKLDQSIHNKKKESQNKIQKDLEELEENKAAMEEKRDVVEYINFNDERTLQIIDEE